MRSVDAIIMLNARVATLEAEVSRRKTLEAELVSSKSLCLLSVVGSAYSADVDVCVVNLIE